MNILSETLLVNRKRWIGELEKGRKFAAELQTLLKNPMEDNGTSKEELAVKILRSFTLALSELTSNEASQIDCAVAGDSGSSACSGESDKNLSDVKDRRGRYKRRRASDSRKTVSPIMDDGYAWRKYGQKNILNSNYPRCYFRCTHKYEGCKATRQVERIKENPTLYQITYFDHHTCTEAIRSSRQIIIDSNPVEPLNLISFQSKIPSNQNGSSNKMINNTRPAKEEFKQDTQSDMSDIKSSLEDSNLWQKIAPMEKESSGYVPVWDSKPQPYCDHDQEVVSSFNYPCSSNGIHGLDMEGIDQFGDIENFHFD